MISAKGKMPILRELGKCFERNTINPSLYGVFCLSIFYKGKPLPPSLTLAFDFR